MKKNISHIDVSIVIPCYNEERRIVPSLQHLLLYLCKQSYTWEIVIIDDGSTDKTVQFAQNILHNVPSQIISLPKNMGKGAALKKGMLSAKGSKIIFTDADLSVPTDHFFEMLETLKQSPVVFSVRKHKHSKIVKHQPLYRELMGHTFTKLSNLFIHPEIVDFTCGCKAFTHSAAQIIFSKTLIHRWAFDAEIAHLAKKYHLSIFQMPISWKHDEQTKVRVFSAAIESFLDLFRIRIHDAQGKYSE